MASRWYVLSCTLNKERVIYHQLHDRGFEVFYPYLIIRTQNPNMLKIEPYFPGYLFVKVDLDTVAESTFRWMPMTEGLVCMADNPAYVPDRIIQAIHRNLWKVNSSILGVPEEVAGIDQTDSAAEIASGNGDLFDQYASATDRSQMLFELLQYVSQISD